MRSLLRYLLIAGFLFILGFMYEYHLPRLKVWLLVEIEALSTKHLPFRILPKEIRLVGWPLGIEVHDIRALPQRELAKTLAPIRIESVTLQLRAQSLLTGDFRLSDVVVKRPEVTLLLKGGESTTKVPAKKIVLKDFLTIPIQKIEIEDALLQIRDEETGVLSRTEDLSLGVENRNTSLFVTVQTPHTFIRKSATQAPYATLATDGAALISEEEVSIRGIKISDGESFVITSGRIKGRINDLKFSNFLVKARSHLDLEPVLRTLKSVFPSLSLPKIVGMFDSELIFAKSDTEPQSFSLKSDVSGLGIDSFKIGRITGDLKLIKDDITSKEIVVRNEAGEVHFNNLSLKADETLAFKTAVNLNSLELRKLLVALSVGDTPLHLDMSGEIPCEGRMKPEFQIQCAGKLNGKQLKVFRPDGKNTIVSIDSFQIDGDVKVDKTAVNTKAKIKIGQSEGEASGSVSFEKGFEFKYSTPALNFKDIANLADLKVEGTFALNGTTSGDTSKAIFGMKLAGNDVWFEDYGLGQASADVSYKEGNLTFKNLEGVFNATRYFASVAVDLNQGTFKADGRLGFAEARDIQKLLSRKFELPFELFGNATAKIAVSGPFEFNKLTYEFDAGVFRGSIGPELFDEAKFYVTANKGRVHAQNIYLKKVGGIATMTGEGYPNGQIDTHIKGRNFKLEDLSLFSGGDSNISGLINFDMGLKGHVLSPDATIKGTIVDTYIGRENVPNSNFEVAFNKTSLSGRTSFLEDKIWADFVFPFDLNTPFKFRARTTKWNFTPLFGLLSKDAPTREFDTELTTDFDLYAKSGGFWNSTGRVDIQSLRIRRGNLELYNPRPAAVVFENGVMNIRDGLLQGDNTYLKAEAQNSTKADFNVSLNGKIEMSLLAFLTPFFSDMRGILSVAGQLDGTVENPKLIGSAFIEKGYAKLKDFPHPFENVKADLLFNQQKIVVNSLQAGFASGSAFAEGAIEIKGLRKFPTDLRGRFEKVTLNVPKDFTTMGSGDFHITGEWFPFLLAGTYNITGGTITRNFGDEAPATDQVRRSTFLPSFLLEKGFSPIKFDMFANFPTGLFVKNLFIDTEIKGAVKITGTPEDPIILGDIATPPGGKIMFRDVPFEISAASVKFNTPTKINPQLYANAFTRIQDYDVTLLLQGTRENYKINLRSTPSLPEQDIISLLALGYTPQQLEKVQSDQQIDQQSYEIGGAILSNNALGKEIRNKYGINVRFSSTVDDTTNTVAPKVIVSKQWTPKINTSASRTIGAAVTQDVKMEYQLNRNVSLIGSWEGREYSEEKKATESLSKNTDIFGLDLQYKMEFK